MKKNEWLATIAPGLEHIVQQELSFEGVESTIEYGGVRFLATREKGAQLVLELFTPNKIRLLLKKTEIKGQSLRGHTLHNITLLVRAAALCCFGWKGMGI